MSELSEHQAKSILSQAGPQETYYERNYKTTGIAPGLIDNDMSTGMEQVRIDGNNAENYEEQQKQEHEEYTDYNQNSEKFEEHSNLNDNNAFSSNIAETDVANLDTSKILIPAPPPKPREVILEKWLPYPEQKRKVIYQKAEPLKNNEPLKNYIIEYEAPKAVAVKHIIEEGITAVDPANYYRNQGDQEKGEICYIDKIKDIPDRPTSHKFSSSSGNVYGNSQENSVVMKDSSDLNSQTQNVNNIGTIEGDRKVKAKAVTATFVTYPTVRKGSLNQQDVESLLINENSDDIAPSTNGNETENFSGNKGKPTSLPNSKENNEKKESIDLASYLLTLETEQSNEEDDIINFVNKETGRQIFQNQNRFNRTSSESTTQSTESKKFNFFSKKKAPNRTTMKNDNKIYEENEESTLEFNNNENGIILGTVPAEKDNEKPNLSEKDIDNLLDNLNLKMEEHMQLPINDEKNNNECPPRNITTVDDVLNFVNKQQNSQSNHEQYVQQNCEQKKCTTINDGIPLKKWFTNSSTANQEMSSAQFSPLPFNKTKQPENNARSSSRTSSQNSRIQPQKPRQVIHYDGIYQSPKNPISKQPNIKLCDRIDGLPKFPPKKVSGYRGKLVPISKMMSSQKKSQKHTHRKEIDESSDSFSSDSSSSTSSDCTYLKELMEKYQKTKGRKNYK
ncbi:hypothetical protein SNEBB_006664 [Seison nebaliae]|nr:hypothetical protein SNEBB_006664 [Seison nebaliae]